MSVGDRHAYICAVKCLQTLPAADERLPRKLSRYEEFVATHTAVATGIHGVVRATPAPGYRMFDKLILRTFRVTSSLGIGSSDSCTKLLSEMSAATTDRFRAYMPG